MKVHELVEQLKEMDQDAEVLMASDPEGNSYSTLYSVSADTMYEEATTWSGDLDTLISEDEESNVVYHSLKNAPIPCVLLEPKY